MSINTESDDENVIEEPNKNIYIIPTSHVSEESSNKVHSMTEKINPDLIAVELDEQRFKKLKSDSESKTSVKKILKHNNLGLKGKIMLISFSKFQSVIAKRLGIDLIGLDMMAGYEESQKRNIPLALVDQDMNITFNRFTNEITFRELFKTLISFIISYIHISRKSEEELKNEVSSENINVAEVIEQIENIFPTFKKVFLDERNEVITEKTAEIAKQFDDTILVIGAAHEPGVRDLFEEKHKNINVKKLPDEEPIEE